MHGGDFDAADFRRSLPHADAGHHLVSPPRKTAQHRRRIRIVNGFAKDLVVDDDGRVGAEDHDRWRGAFSPAIAALKGPRHINHRGR